MQAPPEAVPYHAEPEEAPPAPEDAPVKKAELAVVEV